MRVLTLIKKLDDCFGQFLVRVICDCGAVREIEPEALARLVGWRITLKELALGTRCSRWWPSQGRDRAACQPRRKNAALGGQVFVGSALTGALNPPSSGSFTNPPYVVMFYGNQETDVDVDAGDVLYVLFQFTERDPSLQCNIVIAGYLIDK